MSIATLVIFRRVWLLAAVAWVLPLSAQRGVGVHDGHWAGKTSQEKPIAFTVGKEGITTLEIDWTLPLAEICATTPGSPIGLTRAGAQETYYFRPSSPGNEPPKVLSETFRITRDLGGPAKVKLSLTGKFASSTAAMGTMDLSAENCKGTQRITWQVTKEVRE